ncbi:hypothetical protein GOODEAATRI_007171, partial [Goodea atripinnis]
CRFVQTIPPHFRLPWNHDLQEEPLDRPDEESVSEDEGEVSVDDVSEESDVSSFSAFGELLEVSSEVSGYDTVSSEEEEVDEDEDDLPPQCRFVQTIPPHFRLPWNHDLQEEPLECQEENSLRGTSPRYQESVELDPAPSTSGPCVSRKRTREGDAQEELPAKRISH